MKELTVRQARFLAALFDRTGPGWMCNRRAGLAAGYASVSEGTRLASYPHVRARIEEWFAENLRQCEIRHREDYLRRCRECRERSAKYRRRYLARREMLRKAAHAR